MKWLFGIEVLALHRLCGESRFKTEWIEFRRTAAGKQYASATNTRAMVAYRLPDGPPDQPQTSFIPGTLAKKFESLIGYDPPKGKYGVPWKTCELVQDGTMMELTLLSESADERSAIVNWTDKEPARFPSWEGLLDSTITPGIDANLRFDPELIEIVADVMQRLAPVERREYYTVAWSGFDSTFAKMTLQAGKAEPIATAFIAQILERP